MSHEESHYTRWRDDLNGMLEHEFQRFGGERINVLEAGGGSATFLKENNRPFAFTTIDISPEQLARNTYADEKILGDIEEFDYGDRRFDVIVCWDVLEHIKHPDRALAKLIPALAPGGLLIIKGPIPQSMKGLITSHTPHWLHVLFYRWILGERQAGQPGHAPFRVEHVSGARPDALCDAIRSANLGEVAFWTFESEHAGKLKEKSRLLHVAFSWAARGVEGLTGGRYGGLASDFVLVARNPPVKAGSEDTEVRLTADRRGDHARAS